MIAISFRMRWRSGRKNTVAAATSQKAISPRPHRPLLLSAALTLSAVLDCIGLFPIGSARTGEQPLWAKNENDDHERIDDEGTKARHVVLTGHIGDPEEQGGQEGTGDAGGSADGDDDQEVDHELERECGIESQDFRTQGSTQARQAGADREGGGE